MKKYKLKYLVNKEFIVSEENDFYFDRFKGNICQVSAGPVGHIKTINLANNRGFNVDNEKIIIAKVISRENNPEYYL